MFNGYVCMIGYCDDLLSRMRICIIYVSVRSRLILLFEYEDFYVYSLYAYQRPECNCACIM